MRDLENCINRLLDEETVQNTASLAMIAYDKGLLSTADPVSKFFAVPETRRL